VARIPSLLLVEDNPADVRLLEHAFDEAGLHTRLTVVHDGIEAMHWLGVHRDSVDVVLLDLNLPRMDGREVLAALRGDPRTSELPVIVLSSSHYEGDLSACRDHAVRGYVIKPGGFDEFVDAARRIGRLCEECMSSVP
jgi:CheY-like chemotaxis protein